jgi:hypothetical protein
MKQLKLNKIYLTSYICPRRSKSRFCLLTFALLLAFAYFFSLIEISSNEISLRYGASISNTDLNIVKDRISTKNEYINTEDSIELKLRKSNISKLFLLVHKNKIKITRALDNNELKQVLFLKSKYDSIISKKQIQQKQDYKEEVLKKEKNKIVQLDVALGVPENETTTEDDISYDSLSLITTLDSEETVERNTLIFLLKYEKFKRPNMAVKNIKTLLSMFDSQKEFDIE